MQPTHLPADLADRAYLSTNEVARVFGNTAAFWAKQARERRLPSYRVGKVLIAFKPEDVEAFIESNAVTGPVNCRDGRRRGKRTGRPRKTATA